MLLTLAVLPAFPSRMKLFESLYQSVAESVPSDVVEPRLLRQLIPSFWSRVMREARSIARQISERRQSSYGCSVPSPLESLN